MESSTTACSPDLLLMILLFLKHLTSLPVMLLNSELTIKPRKYKDASETVLSFKFLHILKGIIDQSKTRGATTSYTLENESKRLTEGNLETKEDNTLIISNVVLLGENTLQLILWYRGTFRVYNLKRLDFTTLHMQKTI